MSDDERASLPLWLVIGELLGLASWILVGYWMGHYNDGYGWNDDRIFNFHPLFMVLGMIYINGNGILMYRIFVMIPKKWAKALHAGILTSSLCFTISGLVAIFRAQSSDPNSVYSLHSWVGLGAVVLYCLQLLLGLITFLFPGLKQSMKEWYMPLHRWMGVGVFAIAIAAALLGISEDSGSFPAFSSELMLANFAGIMLILFGLVVGYMVTFPGFKRPKDEDNGEHIPLKEDAPKQAA